jgi:fatty-acyl-CoA synthase
MGLMAYLDKGASLGREAPCLTLDGVSLSYGDVQDLSHAVARALARSGVRAGDKVAILSGNDARAFGIARRGAVWCPINPRNTMAENCELLALFDCVALLYARSYAEIIDGLQLPTLICLDELDAWLGEGADFADTLPDDIVIVVGTGGTTGRPKGVVLTDRTIETMTALTLMGYPFGADAASAGGAQEARPVYLAMAPLTHAAGVLCFPVMALGGEIVVMAKPDLGEFLALVEHHRVTHTFLPPTLIYMLLAHEKLAATDLATAVWSGCRTRSGASGWSRWSSHRRARNCRRRSSSRSPRSGSGA